MNDGGSIFPVVSSLNGDGNLACVNADTGAYIQSHGGMSLRAYFAGQVIGALIASDGFEKQMLSETELPLEALPEFSAQFAVECADALIAELNKEPK